jgi:hypothetical protein
MIRRGFWVLVGATGGIIGYRRVTALGRQLSDTISPTRPVGGVTGDGGAADHSAATPSRAALNRAALTRRARRGLVRGTIRLSRDAVRFSRDVRDGMDLYMVRHAPQGSPTLDPGADSRRSPAPRSLARARSGAPGAITEKASTDKASTDNDERVKDDR